MKERALHHSDKGDFHSHFRLFAVMSSLLFLLSGSAGCLDVELVRDIVNELDGEDEIEPKWKDLLVANGKFDLNVELPPDPTEWLPIGQRIYEKLYTNLSDPGPESPQKVRQVLNEEGVSMKEDKHTFVVPPRSEVVSFYYSVTFTSTLSSERAGYFEMTIKKPDGSTFLFIERAVYGTDKVEATTPLSTDPGLWSVEIAGTGFSQFGLSDAYSGEYNFQARAKVRKDA